MKAVTTKIIFLKVLLLISFVLPIVAHAFHEGGTGYCNGCHILHKAQGNQQESEEESSPGLNKHMLTGSDPSSSCLQCHAQAGKFYAVFSKDGSRYSPGGDFYWILKTFTWNTDGRHYISEGDSHGHNVIAVDYGLYTDTTLTSAPGGEYPSNAMGCTSCHDPHGKTENSNNSSAVSVSGSFGETPENGTIAGNYMLLGGIGYRGGADVNNVSFTQPAPIAVANPFNWEETDSNHTAYGSGMSEWCSNCHINFLNDNGKHPASNNAKLGADITVTYNSYVKTGYLRGTEETAYLALVPFETGTADKSLLNPSSTAGPDPAGQSNVMCLTCHRAHASAFHNIGRWDFSTTFIANSHPRADDSGITGNDHLNSYYGRNMTDTFGNYQRQLCNKCHIKD